jgi:hypothetical protein
VGEAAELPNQGGAVQVGRVRVAWPVGEGVMMTAVEFINRAQGLDERMADLARDRGWAHFHHRNRSLLRSTREKTTGLGAASEVICRGD